MRSLLISIVGGPLLVEIVGYFWHRFAEHYGIMGETIRYRHWVHHEKDYPAERLHSGGTYKDAGSWSWYVLAVITIGGVFLLFPYRDAIPLTLSGVLYARFVVNYFHEKFHLSTHWLHRFHWFRKLTVCHDIHHWASGNYGIVFFFMDRFFGTFRNKFPTQQEILFPGPRH